MYSGMDCAAFKLVDIYGSGCSLETQPFGVVCISKGFAEHGAQGSEE